jgi:hypothetical protein
MALNVELATAVLWLMLPVVVFAQTGTIAGSAKDATGAVLPGVTVEASSAALIEKSRAVVTDGKGEYKIIDLSPGAYTVTFGLSGFNTIRREGIVLTSGTTANVTVEMRVGAIEETVTVSGQSPLVDVQSANQYRAITRDQLNDVPSGRTWFDYVVLVPGVSPTTRGQDVGGSTGDQSQALSIHGSVGNEMPHWLDGLRFGNMFGTGGGTNGPYPINNAIVEEIAVDNSGPSAEAEVAGIRSNIVTKGGGNRFSYFVFANGTSSSLLANNLDDNLRARGAATPAILSKVYDFNPGVGGPVVKDTLWFYAAFRNSGSTEQPAGAFYAVDPYSLLFTPDSSRGPATNPQWTRSFNGRITWQASQKNKVALYSDHNSRCIPCANGLSSAVSWEATTQLQTPVNRLIQVMWTSTISNRLLIEAGESYKPDSWGFYRQPIVRNDVAPIVDSGLGFQYRGPTTAETQQTSYQQNGRLAVSYVTGSHHLKVGTQWFSGTRRRDFQTPDDRWYGFTNRTPTSITVRATPYSASENLRLNLGVFAQEQYTLRRLTMNVGVRYDHVDLYIPAQHLDPVRYVGARDFAEIDDVPKWNDLSPRLGAAYDLFGTGKTALKGSISRYIEAVAGGFPEAVNPITQNAQATRSWNDANGNFVPDCDLTNQALNGECGASNNQNFGRPVIPFSYDPAVATGWGTRGFNWEVSGAVQQELRPGMSIEVSYFRRWYGNLRVTKNRLRSPADYDSYCVTAPTDPRLPTSGQSICGFFDLQPTLPFGASSNTVTATDSFGKVTQHFDGVDVTVNMRLPKRGVLQGGTSTGRTNLNFCAITSRADLVASGGPYSEWTNPYPSTVLIPSDPAFCDVKRPFQTQVKLIAVYALPWWGIQTSAAIQSLPGPEVLATWAAPVTGAASVVSGLNRPLSGSVRTVTIPLIPTGTTYGERLNQVDFRIAKNARVAGVRVQPQIDLYNMLNANPVYGQNNTYGTAWLTPTQVLIGRSIKFGVQVDF